MNVVIQMRRLAAFLALFLLFNYYDPNFIGFSALRVINDDVIEAGQGFGIAA